MWSSYGNTNPFKRNDNFTGAGCSKKEDGYWVVDDPINIAILEKVVTEDACAEKCFQEPKCEYWSYGQNKCYLNHQKGTLKPNPNYVSGNKICGAGYGEYTSLSESPMGLEDQIKQNYELGKKYLC